MIGNKFKLKGVIYPPEFSDLDEDDFVIFLAGPVKDAPEWQKKAISYFKAWQQPKQAEINIVLACPRWPSKVENFDFENQVTWETEYLSRAAIQGAVLFWLPLPANGSTENRCYGQTTRFELGEWLSATRIGNIADAYPVSLGLGVEMGFSGENYIKSRARALAPDLRVQCDLKNTCKYTLGLIQQNPRFTRENGQ